MGSFLTMKLVSHWSTRFEHNKYPRIFYFGSLDAANKAATSSSLKHALKGLFHWKDGKVREDVEGNVKIGNQTYVLATMKPNLYMEAKHGGVLGSAAFFRWATDVRQMTEFDSSMVREIWNKFELWAEPSLVYPAFLLHVLNPRLFPLFDQNVDRARRFFCCEVDGPQSKVVLRDYEEYESFWKGILQDLGYDRKSSDIHAIKEVDDALWSLGKELSKMHLREKRVPGMKKCISKSPKLARMYDTGSPEFKDLVFHYCETMPQGKAMKQAAQDLGVQLPASYTQYPGSHIDRWRKQGFPKLNST